METGSIQIFFGKVVDVKDDKKICRIRVSLDALTDELKTDDLPWYFPWYGLSYLPIKNDVVPVICFDENFSTCFYGNKIDISESKLSDDDYESYLEIYKRSINDKNVQLTYTKSKGIEFINDKNKIQIELDKISFFVDSNSIVVTKDKIILGDKNQEPALLGDKTVKELHDIIKHQSNMITEIFTLFNAISAACVTPFTLPIKAALTPLIPISQTKLKTENSKVDTSADNIQSKKVSNE